MLKKLIEKGLFRNIDAMVSSVFTKEQYNAKQSIQFVEDTFHGSLPKFLTAFASGKKITKKQAEELKSLIDEYEEGE
jgi:BlaI family penicillinase repressor